MVYSSSPVFHGMQAALGTVKHDGPNGCIDAWNCLLDNQPPESFTGIDLYSRGYENFYVELGKYAERLASYYTNLTTTNNGKTPEECYDGLFAIEVSFEFGSWFAVFVKKHFRAPDEAIAFNAIDELVEKYMASPAVVIQLNQDTFPGKEN